MIIYYSGTLKREIAMAYEYNDQERRDQARGKECDIIRAMFDIEFPVWDCQMKRLDALAIYTANYFKTD